MWFDAFCSIRIQDITCKHVVVIEQGQVCKRKKKPSKKSLCRIRTHPAVIG
jgi:hypothetical protein